MDKGLLGALNHWAKASHSSRAALIRAACADYLRKLEKEELDRRYVKGYRRKPESPDLGEAGAKLAAQVWREED